MAGLLTFPRSASCGPYARASSMRIGKLTGVCIAMAGSVLLASPLAAENWAQWRGPHFDGSTSEKNLPESLDPKTDAAWTLDLPGPGPGPPVIWGDRLFDGS